MSNKEDLNDYLKNRLRNKFKNIYTPPEEKD